MRAEALLQTLNPWLLGRCRYVAAGLPGLEVEEVYQGVVQEFLENLERWLLQDPTSSVIAQAKSLLCFCLKHARTKEIRRRRRAGPDLEPEDVDALTEPVAPVDDLGAARILQQIRDCTSPPRALCLLSLRLPPLVEPLDALRAKEWKKGGANAVPRPLEEAWGIYASGRERHDLMADDGRWKEHVGISWYTEGAVESLLPAERKGAGDNVERYANRGAEDLRLALKGEK